MSVRKNLTRYHRLSFTEYVEVLVGPEKKSFSVHKGIICAQSPFFKAACSERWNRITSNGAKLEPIKLPEDNPEYFDIYLHSIYHDHVDVGDTKDSLPGEELWSEEVRLDQRLVETYILADKLGDVVTTNALIDELINESDKARRIPANSTVVSVVGNVHNNSLLYRLFLDYFIYEIDEIQLRKTIDDGLVPATFLLEALAEYRRLCDQQPNYKISEILPFTFTGQQGCRYHQHDEQNPGCGKRCEKVKIK